MKDEKARASHNENDNDTAKNEPSNGNASREVVKSMTADQRSTQQALKKVCDAKEGGMHSFDEVLTLLSCYMAKEVKSSGTKFTMKIGENFKLPVVSVIRCKESKPDLFKFKKVII